MMDVMFEIPSQKKKTYNVTIEYACKQLGKANLRHLQLSE
jgi:ATP-dependent Clp protease ATP-binding subunit ClpX